MTAQTDPYVRVYYSIIDDDKFADVYDNNDRLATWLRLFLTADATYPAPAPLPFGVHKAALAHLVKVGLVDLAPGHRYRIHGLTAERERRSEQARAAARVRHDKSNPPDDAPPGAPAVQPQSGSNATASGTQMHSAPLLSEPLQSDPLPSTPGRKGFRSTNSKEERENSRAESIARNEARLLDQDLSPSLREAVQSELARLRAAA